jgi:DNA-binding NarL/FixJ family response regulator
MTIRVLLADDHALMREGLRALLTSERDITVIGDVFNGREAVRRVLEFNPDIVLMDLTMPDMNGIEATRIIREKSPATKVIILSMHASSEHVFHAFTAGAAGYLLKESASTQLVAALRAVYAGRRYLSPGISLPEHLPSTGRAPLESLSDRERQVLQLVVEGKSSAEVAGVLHLSPKSVETYRSRLMRKLGIEDIPALVKFAILHGITPPA